MHRRFVHSSSAAKATLDFENCHYRSQDEPPDNYTIRRKLMDGLPAEVYRILSLERNINAEESFIDEILTSARQVEQALVRLQQQENREREPRGRSGTPQASAGGVLVRPESRGRDRSRDRGRDRHAGGPPSHEQAFKPVANRPATPAIPRPSVAANSCFGCGQVGHYANDPVCPKFGTPRQANPNGRPPQRTRFHAQRLDMAGDDVGVADEQSGNPYPVDSWTGAGSQYDSDEERGLPPSEGGGSEVTRAQAMSMRVMDVPSDEEDQIVLHMRAGRQPTVEEVPDDAISGVNPDLVLDGHLPYVVEEIRRRKYLAEDDRGPGDLSGHLERPVSPVNSAPESTKDIPSVDYRAAETLDEHTIPRVPHQAQFVYPEDSERPRKHSVPWKRDPRLPDDMPDITERDPISLHSSQGVKRYKYGNEDCYGMNEALYEEVVNYLRELPERSYLKPPEVIPFLREQWFQRVDDLVGPIPLELPPMREINHRIPLIDEQHRYHYHHPRCPDALRGELKTKMDRYLEAGWWEMKPANQAAPLLCVLKKSGKIRTVIDARQRNDNTFKDVTPFPDQDNIRQDVARAKYRSKIDMSDAYEQIRIEVEDVWKTAFSTIFGTAVSHVMQQGDCNAPGTFQRLMTWIFRAYIGVFVHVYLDDIFVFSRSIGEHEAHLKIVFDRLREQRLYLSRAKLDLYSPRMDCLGHLIDDHGLHADTDKMAKI
ncbi:Retrovirus-related Pol polyprotein from transposon 17.6 [Trametes pubescens]|uniref:Retrovirus-related Pol polyprotein from transposon 17.6 n=1 Tax=Trametes pubescens TaxID=154538 RepID=A0A1M2VF23_TRAPU|nr:Retrovirus-related Pol polyprotein from transposon 17.6 [Trametes pubescens]OJT06198.1 Retrovirus-related Pol polyprotein from transposon 17.6 [Trametes pubescens]